MRNVLHICPSLPDTTLYFDLITELSDQDIAQIVYVPLSSDKKFGINQIDKDNVKTIYSNCFTQLDRFIYYTKRNKIFKDIENKVEIEDVDLVHAHYLFSGGGVALKLKQRYNKDYIVAVRNTDINFFWSKMPHLRRNAYKILKNASKIIFISPSSKNKFLNKLLPSRISNLITDKCIVIPNGLNHYWYDNLEIERHILNDELRVIYAGSLDKNKNILKVLSVVEELRKSINIVISVIGKGSLYKTIQNMSKNKKWLTLKPWMNKEELLEEYRRSHLFVMPSTHETFGLVYLEALSQGLPIVHSIDQGIDGYFDDSNFVFKVDPLDQENILQVIKSIKKNYNDINYDIDLDKFRWSKIAEQYQEIYNSKIEKVK